jgi:hypothetical protein
VITREANAAEWRQQGKSTSRIDVILEIRIDVENAETVLPGPESKFSPVATDSVIERQIRQLRNASRRQWLDHLWTLSLQQTLTKLARVMQKRSAKASHTALFTRHNFTSGGPECLPNT